MRTSNGADSPVAPCVLRIPAGSETFDTNWKKDFTDWTGGALAGELIPVGDKTAYIRVMDETLAPTERPEDIYGYLYQPIWRWAAIDPTSDEPMRLIDGEPGVGSVFWTQFDGAAWGYDS